MNHIDVMKQVYQVPLIEQIEEVPADARLVIEHENNGGTTFIPVGRICQDAANALREAIEAAEKNQFNPDWNAINLLSEENLALHKRIAELEAEKPKFQTGNIKP
jgi:hypothetical protein